MSPMTTFELFQDMIAGDKSAESEFVDRIDAMLRQAARCHALYKHLPTDVEVDDIVNDVWRSALAGQSLRKFSDESNGALRAFMLEVLNCRMIDAARRRGRQSSGASSDAGDVLPGIADSSAPSVTAQARASELMTIMQAALGVRDVQLLQGAVNGLTAHELASQHELSHSAAEKALSRAKARARKFLALL